jgi:hypothetical protein
MAARLTTKAEVKALTGRHHHRQRRVTTAAAGVVNSLATGIGRKAITITALAAEIGAHKTDLSSSNQSLEFKTTAAT